MRWIDKVEQKRVLIGRGKMSGGLIGTADVII